VCWEESINGNEEGQKSAVKQYSASGSPDHCAVFIQSLSTTIRPKKQKHILLNDGLLAVYENGVVRLFSEDLSQQHWDFVLSSHGLRNFSVVCVASSDLATAKKSIFKNRSDIVLPSQNEDGIDDLVLLIVTYDEESIHVRLFTIPVLPGRGKPKELLVVKLPMPYDSVRSTTFCAHISTGTLYLLSSTRLVVYNLSSSQPTIVSTLPINYSESEEEHQPTLLRISSSTVLVSTNNQVSLYNTKYSSLQSSVDIDSNPRPSVSSRSSTPAFTSSTNLGGSVFLTTYIPDMDLAIGYSQSGIVGIQFTRNRQSTSVRKSELLIDSLCRGVNGAGRHSPRDSNDHTELAIKLQSDRKKLDKTIAALQAAAAAKDLETFVNAFSDYVGVSLQNSAPPQSVTRDGDDQKNNFIEGQNKHELTFGASPLKPLRTDFVTTVLSMVFTISEERLPDEPPKMVVSMFPSNVVHYLLASGNISMANLSPGEGLVNALYAYDSTLLTLEWFLQFLKDLPISEFLTATTLMLSRLTKVPVDKMDTPSHSQCMAILRLALMRLSLFPTSAIIQSFKLLPPEALSALIELLDNQLLLAKGIDESLENRISLGDINVVVDLLTAALDAVGMSGLILNQSTDVLGGLIESTGYALEDAEQAVELKALMTELFRHVDWHISKSAVEARKKASQKKKRSAVKMSGNSSKNELCVTAEPTIFNTPTSSSVVKKKPRSVLRTQSSKDKRRRDRASAVSQSSRLARINSQRKQKRIACHSKLPPHGVVTKKGHIYGSRAVALSASKPSPILPLGSLNLRRLIDPLVGKELRVDRVMQGTEKTKDGKKNSRRECWMESLAAGTYSLESLVV
jgi:hypothetical protein